MAYIAVKGPLATVTCVAPGGGVTIDTPVLIGDLFGIPAETAAAGASFELQTLGEWTLPKQAGLAISLGEDVFWDNAASECDTTNTNSFIGKCTLAALAGDTTVRVKLFPGNLSTSLAAAVADSDFDANTILKADVDNTPVALTVAEDRIVGRVAGDVIDDLTAAQVRTLINVEDGADVTDAANVNAAGAVMESDYDAQTVLVAVADNTPLPQVVGDSEFVGRPAGGNVGVMTAAQAQTVLGTGAPGSLATGDKSTLVAGINEIQPARHTIINEHFLASAGGTLPQPWAAAETSPVGAVTQAYVNDANMGHFAQTCDAQNEAQTARLDWSDSLHLDPTRDLIIEMGFIWNPAGAAGDANTDAFVGLISAYNSDFDLIASQLGLRVIGANMNLLIESDDGATDASVDSTLDVVKGNLTRVRFDLANLAAVIVHVDLGDGAGFQRLATQPDLSALTNANLLQPAFLLNKNSAAQESLVADYCRVFAPLY